MKKILTVVFIIAFFAIQAKAEGFKLGYGAKAGVNFATFNGDDADNAKMITAYHVGVFAELGITDKLTFQPELLYSAQGSKYEGTILGKTVTIKTKLDYLTIPLMAKYNIINGLTAEFGPQIGFLTSATFKDIDIKDQVNSVDFGLNFGLGYRINDIYVQGRYSLGLTSFGKDSDSKIRNGVIQLSVGYFLF